MRNNKFLKIILILLPIFLLVFVLAISFSNKDGSQTSTSFKPTPTIGTPSTAPFKPSKWAGDEEILSLETQISNLESEMGNTDLRLQPILPPSLDMGIKFE